MSNLKNSNQKGTVVPGIIILVLCIMLAVMVFVAGLGYAVKKFDAWCNGRAALAVFLGQDKKTALDTLCKATGGGTSGGGGAGGSWPFYCGEGKGVTELVLQDQSVITGNGDDSSQYIQWMVDASGRYLQGNVALLTSLIGVASFDKYKISSTEHAGLGQFSKDTAAAQSEFKDGKFYDFSAELKDKSVKDSSSSTLTDKDKLYIKSNMADDTRFDSKKSIYAAAEYFNNAISSTGTICSGKKDADLFECAYLYGYNKDCKNETDTSSPGCKEARDAGLKLKSDYISMMSGNSPSTCQGILGFNGVPLIKQDNYKSVSYDCSPSTTISTSGCGIVSLTMVLQYYGKNVTVEELTQLSLDNKGRACGIGTNYEFFKFAANKYSLKSDVSGSAPTEAKWNEILDHLKNKKPVIVSGTGDTPFTPHGHFIVLVGYDESRKMLYVNDPNLISHNYTDTYSLDIVKSQARSYEIIEP